MTIQTRVCDLYPTTMPPPPPLHEDIVVELDLNLRQAIATLGGGKGGKPIDKFI